MSLIKISLFLLLCVCCEAQLRKEAYMTVPNLIKAAGYPIEKHRVTTEDGYVLQMHRIPAGRRSARRTGDPTAKGKKAILIVHGLLGSSGDFVIMGPERSLAYLLADSGYDVWLGNLRGTVYSTHKNLTRSAPKFWEFSIHEHGKHDVPTMIDAVLNVTGLTKLMFIGYSMGATSFFTMMAQKPEYNDKVSFFVGLAPGVFMDNVRQLATVFMNLDISNVMRSQGTLSLDPQIIQRVMATLCNTRQPEIDLCTNVVFALVGEDYEQNDVEMMPIYMHRVQPASWRQLEHFAKLAITGVFQSWSGGLSAQGQRYNLTNVKVPVSLLYGENDQLTDKFHIMQLADQFKSTGTLEDVRPGCSWPKFNHLDFVFAKDVGTLFNKPLIRHLDSLYNKYGPS